MPDLMDFTKKSIELLNEKYADEGFIVMIESARIDQCGHANDIACLLNEMEEYVEVFQYLYDWAKNDTETLFVSLADHETGGVTVGSAIISKLEDKLAYYPNPGPPDWNPKDS
eukprot:CAMPEP_0114658760 /NCGR_PEP_ID=MMETSP0191-20121206/16359_1 /TAXON_ID=126664 /ORGANISM="Sorites sp." /LENGTH=112 /DNA_ID=CAMNT_0001881683 /DNA_START=408 /DNA_END=746 /DNA_ORIENTATION=+